MKKMESFINAYSRKILMLLAVLLSPAFLLAAETGSSNTTNSMYVNPLFLLLMLMALILLIIILTMGKVLVNVAGYYARNKDTVNRIVALLIISSLALFPVDSYGQAAGKALLPASYSGVPASVFYLLLFIILFEVLIVFIILSVINKLLASRETVEVPAAMVKRAPGFWEKFIAAAPADGMEEEKMTDHNYDGITELDNGMPPWLQYMFIGTIIFAVFYLLNYQVWKTSPLQLEEYANELAYADAQMIEFHKKSANRVDETNVVLLTDETTQKEGLSIFKTNCTACHGQLGEGGVGPNLTDNYWIHGGNIKDLFKTIKYGVVEKGMKSWQADISPKQIQQVASYIKTLTGTNPPNQKEKQGDFYSEEQSVQVDTLVNKSDTTIAVKSDSLTTAVRQ